MGGQICYRCIPGKQRAIKIKSKLNLTPLGIERKIVMTNTAKLKTKL
jgi:hypothetical protein